MDATSTSSSHGPRPDGRAFGPIGPILLLDLLLCQTLLCLLLIKLHDLLQGFLHGLLRSDRDLKIDVVAWVSP